VEIISLLPEKQIRMTTVPAVLAGLILLAGMESLSAVEKITVLGLFRDRAVVRIDGKQRILSPGKASPEGVLLIRANSREAVLEVDGRRDTYTLGDHIGSSFKKPAGGNISTIAPDGNGMYWVNGSINGFQVSFVVDTGATLISMNRHEATRIGLNYKLEGRESTSSTAAGMSKIYIVNLDSVRVGDIELEDVRAAVHDSDYPEAVLLGNSFLNRVKLNRDGRILTLEDR